MIWNLKKILQIDNFTFIHPVNVLYAARGPQINECNNKGPAGISSPKASLSMYGVEGGNISNNLKIFLIILTNWEINIKKIGTYLQHIEKQYWIAHKPVNVILSFPSGTDFFKILVWFIILSISISASTNNGYFILSGVPKMKLQA